MPSLLTTARRIARAEARLGPGVAGDRRPLPLGLVRRRLPLRAARRRMHRPTPAPGPPSGPRRAIGGPGCCSAAAPPARPAPPPSWSDTGPSRGRPAASGSSPPPPPITAIR